MTNIKEIVYFAWCEWALWKRLVCYGIVHLVMCVVPCVCAFV